MARVALLGLVLLAAWGAGGVAGIDALAMPDSPWVMVQQLDASGITIWAKRLSLKDRGLPVVLREERQRFSSHARLRYLITVDCGGRLQAVRQFWSSGEPGWKVLEPLEWTPPGDPVALKIQQLACPTLPR
ncbi:hypothetical protein KBY85_14245 [Cyanobium sp. BA5m-10]|uniref:hypothetical protein n=1 Tax=Cyanobium sp. BA5m-10 TaxID=2823705 RepID=UPI0020CDB2B7|nr:hypothetical protein [Cyanobium sp. BA5m-10]MCP9905286.1 hypothetical protein [Cyanobium sp. BA5m-10]